MRRQAATQRILGTVAAAEDFRALYDHEIGYVWRSLQQLGVPEQDRQDVAHEVFITAWRRLDTYDHRRPIRPWIGGIAFRMALAHHRRASLKRDRLAEVIEAEDPSPSPEGHLADLQQRRFLQRALHELDLDKRFILVMHDHDEIAMSEIARALEIPLMTAYSRLRLARKAWVTAVRRLTDTNAPSTQAALSASVAWGTRR